MEELFTVCVIEEKSNFETCQFAIQPTGDAAKILYRCTTTLAGGLAQLVATLIGSTKLLYAGPG